MKKIDFIYNGWRKKTLKDFLKNKSFSDLRNIYREKRVLINNKTLEFFSYPFYIKRKDIVSVILPNETCNIPLSKHHINIVYEDDYFLVIDKPANLVTINSKKYYNDSLASRIVNYYRQHNMNSTIHFVNRLDYLTAGLVIVAKYSFIHYLFSKISITKKYYGLINGRINPRKKKVKVKLIKDENTGKRIVSKTGKVCITCYKTLMYKDNKSLLEFRLITGRTHQIRATMAYLNHPLLNDSLYGTCKENENLSLQSYYIGFKHPITKEKMQFSIPIRII